MGPIYASETVYLSLDVMNRDRPFRLISLVLSPNLFLKNAYNGNINQHNNNNNNDNNSNNSNDMIIRLK